MLKIDELNENQVLAMTASGKLHKEDYDRVLPELEGLLDKYGKLRFFIRGYPKTLLSSKSTHPR